MLLVLILLGKQHGVVITEFFLSKIERISSLLYPSGLLIPVFSQVLTKQ